MIFSKLYKPFVVGIVLLSLTATVMAQTGPPVETKNPTAIISLPLQDKRVSAALKLKPLIP
jgi:hypothetical protein